MRIEGAVGLIVMRRLYRRSAWLVLCGLSVAGGACRKAGPGAVTPGDVAREAAPASTPMTEAGEAATSPMEVRTAEALFARILELGGIPDEAARKQAWATLLAGLTDEERATILETLWAAGDEAARARFAEGFGLWCETEPQAAAKWAATMWDAIPGRDGERLREQAGLAWAARDFAPAFAWALTLRDVGSEWSLAAKLLKQVAQHDPKRALELAREVSETFYATALNRIFAGWVDLDPAAAFAELGLRCSRTSSGYLHQLGRWADRDPLAAVRWTLANDINGLGSIGGFVKDKGALVQALYGVDLTWPMGRNELSNYLNQWLGADLAGAVAWLDALPAGEARDALIAKGAAYRAWSGRDGVFIATALPLIVRLPEGEKRSALLTTFLADWGRSDPEAALNWAKGWSEDPGARDAALVGAIGGLAKLDPTAAQGHLPSLSQDAARVNAERELAAGWAESDGRAAAAWLNARQPDWLVEWDGGEEVGNFSSLKYGVVAGWLAADPDALFAWAAGRANQEEAQGILGNAALRLGLGGLLNDKQPARALEVMSRLSDAKIRRNMLSTLAMNWAGVGKDERAKIRASVEACPLLTPEEKQSMLKDR